MTAATIKDSFIRFIKIIRKMMLSMIEVTVANVNYDVVANWKKKLGLWKHRLDLYRGVIPPMSVLI